MMESISKEVKYFVTPNNNIVRGAIDGGKLIDAEFFVSKKNDYSTASQLNNLMKERHSLAQGKINLKQIERINYNDFDIPIDAGAKNVMTKRNIIPRTSKNIKGSKKFISGGDVDITDSTNIIDKINIPEDSINEIILDDTIVAGVSKQTKSKSLKLQQSKAKLSKTANECLFAGNLSDKKNDNISLADIFKQVSQQLANQAADIIVRGGNPAELIRDDIMFFNSD
jgi:hypothetical protein